MWQENLEVVRRVNEATEAKDMEALVAEHQEALDAAGLRE
jgi:hypothetical protein